MKHFTKLMSLLLALTMLLGMLPMQVLALENDGLDEQVTAQQTEEPAADEPMKEETVAEEPVAEPTDAAQEAAEPVQEAPEAVAFSKSVATRWVNPLYADQSQEEEGTPVQPPIARSSPYYYSLEGAIKELRGEMLDRTEQIQIYCYTENDPSLSESQMQEYVGVIWELVMLGAMGHDGKPDHGDYLAMHVEEVAGSAAYDDSDRDTLYLMLGFECEYTTNLTQEEAAMAAMYNQVRNAGWLELTAEYDKVEAIYDYLTQNVVFDQKGLNNSSDKLKNTAYGAMIEKSAVGPGYAAAFYFMALYAGLDCRIVVDTAYNPHAWVIVKIGDYYYNLDPAWDAKRVQAGKERKYFLKSNETFLADHNTADIYLSEEFLSVYPVSPEDYPEGILAFGAYGTISWVLTADGTLTFSGTGPIPGKMELEEAGASLWHDYAASVKRGVIGEGITEIGERTFLDSNVVSVSIPDSVKTIRGGAFQGCGELLSVEIPEGSEKIYSSTFSGCKKLQKIEIPDTVTEIGSRAFSNCDALTECIIPEGVTLIESKAFFGCVGLKSVVLPANLTMQSGVFERCTGLEYAKLQENTTFGDELFRDCSSLKTVELSEGIKSINWLMFVNCTSLEQMILPEGLTQIGKQAFQGCRAMKQIVIPDTVTSIGDSAFWSCASLKELVIPDSVTTIGEAPLSSCTGLEKIVLPNKMKTLPDQLFTNCTSLKEVVFPENLSQISYRMFAYCTSLEELVFPESVTDVQYDAFPECTSLSKLVFTGDCPNFDSEAFMGLTATVYYPFNRSGWTEDKLKDYGGSITWEPYRAEGVKFDIAFANMTLGNSLDMNFAFPQDGTDNWEGAFAQIAKTYADGRGTKVVNIPISQWGQTTINGEAYYTLKFNGIAAKEMADEIYITVYNGDRKPISNNWEDSVRSYAMRTLNNPKTSAESMTMIVDLLNYGAAAQLNFKYDTENLANNKLTPQQAALATPSAEAEDGRIKGDGYIASQLVLESKIILRMAFSGVTEDMSAEITFTDHYNRPRRFTIPAGEIEFSGSRADITIDQIVVADARQDVTVQIFDGEGNVVASATDSVASYIARMRQEKEEDPLFESILKFADSAYLYFHPGEKLPDRPEHSELYIEGLSQDQVVEYFNEVCFGAEFGNNTPYIRKWTQPIYYEVTGDPFDPDLVILENYVAQLNALEGFPGLYEADPFDDPVLSISFCTQIDLEEILGSWGDNADYEGAVTIWYDENYAITSSKIGVRKDLDQNTRESVLKEEIYNGLGPLMDTVDRTDSIIYQYGSSVTELSEIDWLILKLLYNEAILPGMDAAQCEEVLRSLYW